MHDGIELERRGVPTAVVATDLFEPTARGLAELQGVPDFPLVLIPHPLGRCSREALREKPRRRLPPSLRY
ncbi:MAG TPA: hypothetical protein VIL95_07450 [Bacillota bacterium]